MFDRLGWLVLRLRYVLVAGWLIAAALFGILARPCRRPAPPTKRVSCRAMPSPWRLARSSPKAFPADSSASIALIVFSRSGGLTDADRSAIEGLRGYFEGAGHPDIVKAYVTAERTTSAGLDVPQLG